jgi:peptidoglycan/LPS O-acetylase OafA/YrhL
MRATEPHLGYRAHLDGLRALAVVLVIAFHAGYAAVPGGFVGVDVFFVLSGYLITRLLAAELADRGRLRVARFYARRMRRLLPASALALAGIVVASVHLLDRAQQQPIAGDVRWAALWSANWRFVQARVDYFAPGDVPSPVVHYWSLAVEEQFYLVWPALLFGLWYLLARRAPRPTGALVVAVSTLAAASAVASIVLTPSDAAYYGTHTRAYQLLAGALLALVLVRRERTADAPRPAPAAWATAAAVVGLLLVGFVALTVDGAGSYPGWPALVVTAGTVLVIGALEAGAPGPVHRTLGFGPAAAVGRVSYSLYLWHWPVLVFAPLLALRWERTWLDDRPVMFAAMGVLATASYLAFERPIRFRLAPAARPRAVIGTGLALSSLVAVLVVWPLLPTGEDERVALAAVRDMARPEPCPYFADEWPDPDDAEPCEWRAGGPFSILLVGDSHAQMWQPAIDVIAARHDLTVHRLTRGGCPANDVTVYHFDDVDGSKVADHECTAWRSRLYQRAVEELDPDLVLVSTRSHVLGVEVDGRFLGPRDEGHLALWTAGFERSLAWLTAGGAQVVVSEILPTLPERVPACLAEHGLGTKQCDWPASVDERVVPFNEAIRSLPALVPGVSVIDPTPLGCPAGMCSAFVDGVVVHRDDNHLSRTWVARLGGELQELLRGVGVAFPPTP